MAATGIGRATLDAPPARGPLLAGICLAAGVCLPVWVLLRSCVELLRPASVPHDLVQGCFLAGWFAAVCAAACFFVAARRLAVPRFFALWCGVVLVVSSGAISWRHWDFTLTLVPAWLGAAGLGLCMGALAGRAPGAIAATLGAGVACLLAGLVLGRWALPWLITPCAVGAALVLSAALAPAVRDRPAAARAILAVAGGITIWAAGILVCVATAGIDAASWWSHTEQRLPTDRHHVVKVVGFPLQWLRSGPDAPGALVPGHGFYANFANLGICVAACGAFGLLVPRERLRAVCAAAGLAAAFVAVAAAERLNALFD